jgi:hypothetical protein
MATNASHILTTVANALADDTLVRWTTSELCRYFNDGQRAILEYAPDAKTITAPLALVAGARQSLPAGAASLLDVIGNTDAKMRAVRKCDRKVLDAQFPAWRSYTQALEIQNYTYDERDSTVFFVYPPAAVGASLDVMYSAYPTDISTAYADGTLPSAVTGTMNLPDEYGNALREYVLYRAFTKDGEHPSNQQRAATHWGSFMSALGIEEEGNAKTNPRPAPAP